MNSGADIADKIGEAVPVPRCVSGGNKVVLGADDLVLGRTREADAVAATADP